VILDSDLAAMYEVEPKVLNRAVKRNVERFPEDFMFQLSAAEAELLRSQMLSTVLRSARAVQVNIEIMRAFVRLRSMLQANTELAKKLALLEKKYDAQFRVVFDAIRELTAPQGRPKRRIGFRTERA
jgi:hypothetical protein